MTRLAELVKALLPRDPETGTLLDSWTWRLSRVLEAERWSRYTKEGPNAFDSTLLPAMVQSIFECAASPNVTLESGRQYAQACTWLNNSIPDHQLDWNQLPPRFHADTFPKLRTIMWQPELYQEFYRSWVGWSKATSPEFGAAWAKFVVATGTGTLVEAREHDLKTLFVLHLVTGMSPRQYARDISKPIVEKSSRTELPTERPDLNVRPGTYKLEVSIPKDNRLQYSMTISNLKTTEAPAEMNISEVVMAVVAPAVDFVRELNKLQREYSVPYQELADELTLALDVIRTRLSNANNRPVQQVQQYRIVESPFVVDFDPVEDPGPVEDSSPEQDS